MKTELSIAEPARRVFFLICRLKLNGSSGYYRSSILLRVLKYTCHWNKTIQTQWKEIRFLEASCLNIVMVEFERQYWEVETKHQKLNTQYSFFIVLPKMALCVAPFLFICEYWSMILCVFMLMKKSNFSIQLIIFSMECLEGNIQTYDVLFFCLVLSKLVQDAGLSGITQHKS